MLPDPNPRTYRRVRTEESRPDVDRACGKGTLLAHVHVTWRPQSQAFLWARLAWALLLHLPLWSPIWNHSISQEILECVFISLETKNHYKPGVIMYTLNSSIFKAGADYAL